MLAAKRVVEGSRGQRRSVERAELPAVSLPSASAEINNNNKASGGGELFMAAPPLPVAAASPPPAAGTPAHCRRHYHLSPSCSLAEFIAADKEPTHIINAVIFPLGM